MVTQDAEEQVKLLAREYSQGDDSVLRVYRLPAPEGEIHLIVVSKDVPKEQDGKVHPFYFSPDTKRGLPYPFAVALLHPDEEKKAALPEQGWGSWNEAQALSYQ